MHSNEISVQKPNVTFEAGYRRRRGEALLHYGVRILKIIIVNVIW